MIKIEESKNKNPKRDRRLTRFELLIRTIPVILIFTLIIYIVKRCSTDNDYKSVKIDNKTEIKDSILSIKYVKDLKVINETKTTYNYNYDILLGEFIKVPKVESDNKYYLIFTDNSIEEVNKDVWLTTEKGDTIKKYLTFQK